MQIQPEPHDCRHTQAALINTSLGIDAICEISEANSLLEAKSTCVTVTQIGATDQHGGSAKQRPCWSALSYFFLGGGNMLEVKLFRFGLETSHSISMIEWRCDLVFVHVCQHMFDIQESQ